MMTYKERFLATVSGQPTDCLPFIPRLDIWYRANKVAGTLPDKYKNASLTEITDDMGVGVHSIVPDFMDYYDPIDIIDRALGAYRLRTLPFKTIFRDIERNVFYDGSRTVVEYLTPKGKITTKVIYDDGMKKSGVTITHVEEPAIKSVNDYEAVAYIFEHAEIIPQYDHFLTKVNEVGDRGVAVAYASLAACGMQLILRDLIPFELLCYEMMDHPEELKWLAGKIDGYYEKIIDVVAKSPAQVVLLGGNYDRSITSPPFFKEHIAPKLTASIEKLHQYGKLVATHTDGENKGLLEQYVSCNVDIADSICPKPMTSQTLKEVRDVFEDKVTIWGAVPSISVLENTMTEYEFDGYMDNLLKDAGRGDHLILSIADTTPPQAKFSRIEKIAKLARDFGPIK